MLQLGIEHAVASLRPVFRYVLTIINVKTLHICDETSLTVTRIVVSLTPNEKWPLHQFTKFVRVFALDNPFVYKF